jgi:hypothetical protein
MEKGVGIALVPTRRGSALSANDDVTVEEASDEVKAAFAKFLEVISSEEGREAFTETPRHTLGEERAAILPKELLGFLEALSVEELALLHRLCKRTRGAGLFTRHGNVTLCHL